MSVELRESLDKIAQEDCKGVQVKVEAELPYLREFMLKIAQTKTIDLAVSVEGTPQRNREDDVSRLSLLERAGYVVGETKVTSRNVYCHYQLTAKGEELVQKLAKETEQIEVQPEA
jgi:hypothetical protein